MNRPHKRWSTWVAFSVLVVSVFMAQPTIASFFAFLMEAFLLFILVNVAHWEAK